MYLGPRPGIQITLKHKLATSVHLTQIQSYTSLWPNLSYLSHLKSYFFILPNVSCVLILPCFSSALSIDSFQVQLQQEEPLPAHEEPIFTQSSAANPFTEQQ